jgi:branched-chain amino acid transport system ATP-binding protein
MSASESAALLSVEAITLSFSGVTALRDVGFAVARGEICAVIGPNGAGKSSLLNVISGVYRPDRGVVRFEGKPLPAADPRAAAQHAIARTFQNIALFRGMSVLDNVISGRALSGESSFLEQALRLGRARSDERVHREKAEEVLEFLRIQRHRHSVVGKLPYGLQKRVELGRALVSAPRLLLLDEPMAGMTFAEKEEMCRFVADANVELGTTIVLIEHDVGVVMDLSDHVVVLDYGGLIADGTPGQVAGDARVIEAYLGAAE